MWRVLLLLLVDSIYGVHTSIQNTFNKNKIIFNHLAVDYKTGAVYVGAVNRIFQLLPDLQIAQNVVTGPVYDSQLCSFDCPGVVKVPKNNFNKVLVIDYDHNRLITCGSVSQGMCSSRPLDNIHISHDVPKAVAANDPTATTVAFIAPGPPDPNTTQVMYTGVTFTGSFVHRYHVPAVSSLSLEDHRLFDVAKVFCEFCHSDQVTGTRLFINTMYRDQYIVNYIYGFSSGTFSYFLTTQRNIDGVYQSKIIRICHNDEQYHSYTETPISCKQNENNNYNLVEAGFVAKSGKNLAKTLGISEEQDVLYTIFTSQKINGTSTANTSVLCIYTIQDINEKIGASIENCFKGEGMRGLPHVLPNRKCVKHNLKSKGSDFCGTNVNTPLGSELPIETRCVTEFNETLTAIIATSIGNRTAVFAGTAKGHLKKIVIESATSAFEYGDITVDKGSPVNKDLIFDSQRTYLYVMTKHRVSKVKLHQCSEYKSCSTCVTAEDPFCGWCVVENKCSIQSECKNARDDPLFWLSYNVSQCTVIAQVTPIHIQRKYESVLQSFTKQTPNSSFNHLVMNRNTGNVYIGAVNRIYQLSPELEVAQWVVTGPVNDSLLCSVDCPAEYDKTLTDNVNKALVIDYTNSRLITCGSVHQGICSVRNLNNISHDVHEVNEAIVANDATSSTVAFIGPGPLNPPITQVMYVGVTYTKNSPYRFEIPAVSSRSLEDDQLFMIAQMSSMSGTRMYINSLSRERYPINYVYGFSSEGFSYFLTIQLKHIVSVTYHSKLVRVCQDDEEYNSYTEIPISCKKGTENYNDYNLVQAAFVAKAGTHLAEELGITAQDDVLFAVFSVSESVYTNTPSNSSALCVYSLKAIRRKFLHNIKECYSGRGYRGLEFISPSQSCIPVKMQSIKEDFCGLPINTPLGGEQPVETEPVAIFTTRLTAVAASSTGSNTVVFAGTAQGRLKKILVESATNAVEYDDIIVDEGYAINKDLVFDPQQMHLYVMTERKVSKLKVHQCGEHKKCFSCVAVKDPYCEWCEVDKKCGPRAQCKKFDVNNSHCSDSTTAQDTKIGRTAGAPLQLLVENMPMDYVELLCVFTLPTGTVIMNATRREYGVDCLTPDTEKLPRAPGGQHEYSAKLALTTVNGSEFAATKIMFFACSSYISCTECTGSHFGCNWDLADSVCIDAAGQYSNMIVTNKKSQEPSQKITSVCPKLLAPERIWIPAGFNVNVKVKVRGIRPDMAEKLYCMYKVDARTKVVNGKFHNNVVRCDDAILDYESSAPVMSASLTVAWDEWKRLDNPHGVHLKIYKCALMASDEHSCNLIPKTYMCQWNAKGTCEYQITRSNSTEALLTDFTSLTWR